MVIAIPSVGFRSVITSTGLNTALSTVGTELNRVATLADAAVSTGSVANAGKLAKYDAGGGLTLGTTNIIVPAAGQYGLFVQGYSGQNVDFVHVQTSGGADVFKVDLNKKAYFFNDVAVSGGNFLGNVTGNVSGTAGSAATATTATTATTAGSLTAPVLVTGLIADYKPVASVSAGQIVVSAGGAFEDSAQNSIGPLAQQTATLPTQPTGTNSQYVAISMAPATGAPVATAGTAAASPTKPAFPAGNTPVAMVLWRGATTLPTGIVAAADIIDHRALGGTGGGSGGTTTDTSARAGVFLTAGAPGATFPNAVNAQTAGAANIGTSTGSALLNDALRAAASGNIMAALQASGTTLQLVGTLGRPIFVAANKLWATLSTILNSGALPSSAGVYTLLLDTTTNPPSLTIAAAPATTSGNQIAVCNLYYDGAAWHTGTGEVDWSLAFPIISSPLYQPMKQNYAWAGVAQAYVAGAFGRLTGQPSAFTFNFPCPLRYLLQWQCWTSSATVGAQGQVTAVVDNASVGYTSIYQQAVASQFEMLTGFFEASTPLSAGQHTFDLQYLNNTAASTITWSNIIYRVEAFR